MIGARVVPPQELAAMPLEHDVTCRLALLPGCADRALLEVRCIECGSVSVVVIDTTRLDDRHRTWISNHGAATFCVEVH